MLATHTGRNQMADTFTSDTYDALCQEAEGYLARGLSEQARELLLKAASLIGTRPRARSLLADACMSLGLWEEARSQLENLTTLEVDNYHNHFRLGQVLEELSENQLARDNYNVVLDHSPDHHGAKVALNRLEAADDTTDVNLASFFAAGSSSTDSEPEVPSEDTDSGNVVESVFGSTQVFPDAQTDDVFAGEEDIGQSVDKLLKDLGVGSYTQETSGAVSELLSSLGITPDGDEDEGNKVIEKVDISSILSTDSAPGGEEVATGEVDAPEPAASADAVQDEATVLESAFAAAPEPSSPDAEPEDDVIALESVFAAPSEPEPVAEEPPAPSQIDQETDTGTAVLESVFSTAQEEKAVEEPTPLEPAAEESPLDEKKEVGMLESIFGSPAKEPSAPEPAAEEPAPEPVAEEPPEPEPEPAAEEPAPEPAAEEPPEPAPEPPAEEPLAPEPAAEEPAPEPVVEEPPEPAPEPPAEEPSAPEPAAEEPAPEPVVEEPPVPEPVAVEASVEEVVSEAPPAAAEPAVYTIHKPDFESLVIVELEKGTLAVRQAYIAAMNSHLNLEADDGKRLISGSGSIWLGQGGRTPVIIAIEQGMCVRSDRMVLFDSCVIESPADIADVPALVRLEAPEGSEMLCFAGGRIREVFLPGDNRTTLTVRSSSLLAAGKDIELQKKPDSPDFLTLSGCGRIYISG